MLACHLTGLYMNHLVMPMEYIVTFGGKEVLCELENNAESTVLLSQDVAYMGPALLTLPACVLSLVINLELPISWPAVRSVGGGVGLLLSVVACR